MTPNELGKLDKLIYARSIHPLRRHATYDGDILGFDVEYTSDGHKLLSMQLWSDGRGLFVPIRKMTMEALIKACWKVLGRRSKSLLLISYFSWAEIQFLPIRKAFEAAEFGGTADVAWYHDVEGTIVHLQLTDAWRWFNGSSLAEAAKSMGLKKLEWDTAHVTEKTIRDPKFKTYALNDAMLAYEIYTRLRKEFAEKQVDIVMSKTPASASAAVFRIHYVPEDIGKWHSGSNDVRKAACQSLWGGRVEALERGVLGTYTEMDLKSAYPSSVVSFGEFPIQGCWREWKAPSDFKARGGVFHVAFEFPPETHVPCLNAVSEDGDQIYCLKGESWTTLDELNLAREMGAKIEVLKGFVFDHGTDSAARYMADCLRRKAESSGARAQMEKLSANSFVGKLAQKVPKRMRDSLWLIARKTGYLIDDLADMSLEELAGPAAEAGVKPVKYSLGVIWMPEWNALTTGRVRAWLGRALWKHGGVYSHTDSVWTLHPDDFDQKLWKRKETGPVVVARQRFAKMDLEGREPKMPHHSITNWEAAKKMLERFDGSKDIRMKYTKSRPLHLKEAMARGLNPGHWIGPGEPGYERVGKTNWDWRRRLLPDRRHTQPWGLLEDYYIAISEIPK